MKIPILILTIIFNYSLCIAQSSEVDIGNLFSKEYSLDFLNSGCQVKLAPNGSNGETRVWIKGSQLFPFAKYKQEDNSFVTIQLLPPYYTTIIKFKSNNAPISIFFTKNGNDSETKELKVFPNSIKNKNKYSILVYSCYQPFEFDNKTLKFVPDTQSNQSNFKIRKVFEDVALSRKMKFAEKWIAGKGVIKLDSKISDFKPINDPVLLVGVGDQVYVDAGYDEKDCLPYMPWEVGVKPKLKSTISLNNYSLYLNSLYENFYSFKTMQNVFQRLPTLNIWDDHEIRDGWGSHGDEYTDERLMGAYKCSKEAFVQNMYLHPKSLDSNYLNKDYTLEQSYNESDINMFLFDLRSCRDINRKSVIDDSQWIKFENWCDNVPNGKTIIIGSSIPLFWKLKPKLGEAYVKLTKGEAQDDINDAWDSEINRAQRDRLVSKILELKLQRQINTIVLSGDIHIGALCEIWYNPDPNDRNKRQVLCYEMITSGLSHESLKGKIEDVWVLKKSEGQRTNETLTAIKQNDVNYQINNTVKVSEAYHNFGAINYNDGNIELQLFVRRPKDDFINNYVMKCNWSKTNNEEIKLEKRKWWSVTGNTYVPAPIDEVYVIETK